MKLYFSSQDVKYISDNFKRLEVYAERLDQIQRYGRSESQHTAAEILYDLNSG